jgi:integrase
VPGEKTKSRRTHYVPLTDAALVVLKRRHEQAEDDAPFVLPGRRAGSPLQSMKTTWAAVLEKARINDLRVHDLRHTLASWMAKTGASEYIIARALGHTAATVTARYSHISAEPVRAAMNCAIIAMDAEIMEQEKLARKKDVVAKIGGDA